MKTFKELYLAGEIEFEAIDDYVMEWGNSEDERTLAQYLGLNADEEDAWVSDSEEAMKELLTGRKNEMHDRTELKPIAYIRTDFPEKFGIPGRAIWWMG